MATIHHLPASREHAVVPNLHAQGSGGQVLRLPTNSDTPEMRFERAYHDASIAQAEYRLNEARRFAHVQLAGPDHWKTNPYNGEACFDLMRTTMFKMAITPVASRAQLARKKHLIGKVWLGAEGEFYDALRAGVTIDELRFGRNSNGRKARHG